MVNVLEVRLNLYPITKFDLVGRLESGFSMWQSQSVYCGRADNCVRNGNAKLIVGAATERASLGCPHTKIARHGLRAALSNANPNPPS